MRFEMKFLAACSALAMASLANAQSVNETTGSSASAGPYTFSGLTGSGTLSFSAALVGATNSAFAVLSADPPATLNAPLNARDLYTSAAATAPVTSLSGTVSGNTLNVTQVATAGGATVTTTADGFTNSGGSLSIDDITVNLSTDTVYAQLTGANGLGTQTVALWTYSSITGPTSFTLPAGGHSATLSATDTITGLQFTTVGLNDFIQALGLLPGGSAALSSVTNAGSIESTITSNVVAVATVPEPSSIVLLVAGLAGVGLTSMRRMGRRDSK